MHNLLITLISYVLGHNLAINGPLGSVVNAVDGMYSYRSSVVCSYIIMMIALAFNVVGINLVIMDVPAGAATSTLVGWCIHYSYTRSICVYHRFKTSHREESHLHKKVGSSSSIPRRRWDIIRSAKRATKRVGRAFGRGSLHEKLIKSESLDGKEYFCIFHQGVCTSSPLFCVCPHTGQIETES